MCRTSQHDTEPDKAKTPAWPCRSRVSISSNQTVGADDHDQQVQSGPERRTPVVCQAGLHFVLKRFATMSSVQGQKFRLAAGRDSTSFPTCAG